MKTIHVVATAIGLMLVGAWLALTPTSWADSETPIKGQGTGSAEFNSTTGDFTVNESGHSSHLGMYTVQLQGTGTRSDDGAFSGTGTATFVAANGQQLTGTFTASGSNGRTTTLVTLTGGTGRFAKTGGTLTIICDQVGNPSSDGPVVRFELDCTHRGTLSRGSH